MTKKFTPIDFLNKKEQALLSEMRINIENAKTLDEIKNYKTVLDFLLEKSAENYIKEQKKENNKEDLQHA